MKKTAIANHKGGVTKTTSTFNLACLFADGGNKKVLAIDLDPQASLTKVLGIAPKNLRLSISDIFLNDKLPITEVIRSTNVPGVFLIPATSQLSNTEKHLVTVFNRERILARRLKGLQGFDHVLIDCPPALDLLNTNGIAAADEILIPVESSDIAVKALNDFMRTIDEIRTEVNPNVELAGIFLTKHKERTTHGRGVHEALTAQYPGKLLHTVIPDSVVAKDSTALGQSVVDLQPRSAIAEAYRNLKAELESHAEHA